MDACQDVSEYDILYNIVVHNTFPVPDEVSKNKKDALRSKCGEWFHESCETIPKAIII